MNKSIVIKNLEIGKGIPKVCVSITGKTFEEIVSKAEEYNKLDIDILEWRADYYDDIEDISKVKNILNSLSFILKHKPLIFTFRTKGEGGERSIEKENYINLCNEVIKNGKADLIDLELFTGEKEVGELVEAAHKNNIKVIISNHDFNKTPEEIEIKSRIEKMILLGGDIPKIAVMPNSEEDVLKLLSCTNDVNKKYKDVPIITMSMGSLGVVSRLSGEIFGSAVTFACVESVSAPGQIFYKDLKNILKIIHK